MPYFLGLGITAATERAILTVPAATDHRRVPNRKSIPYSPPPGTLGASNAHSPREEQRSSSSFHVLLKVHMTAPLSVSDRFTHLPRCGAYLARPLPRSNGGRGW